MIPTKAGSYIVLCLSVLLLAACASGTGMSSAHKQQLQQLTPAEAISLAMKPPASCAPAS